MRLPPHKHVLKQLSACVRGGEQELKTRCKLAYLVDVECSLARRHEFACTKPNCCRAVAQGVRRLPVVACSKGTGGP
eukprot:1149988-Pelagomonas_calceolata.AAC.2